MLCAVAIALKRLRAADAADAAAAQKAVNVKRIVGHLRRQRPGMVQNYEQYLFCYQVCLLLLRAHLILLRASIKVGQAGIRSNAQYWILWSFCSRVLAGSFAKLGCSASKVPESQAACRLTELCMKVRDCGRRGGVRNEVAWLLHLQALKEELDEMLGPVAIGHSALTRNTSRS